MAAKAAIPCGPEAAALVLEHWEWARGFARKKARDVPSLEEGEVIGVALVALVDAARRFDPGKRVEFRSFALFRMRGAIRDYQRTLDPIGRHQRDSLNRGYVTKWARGGGFVPTRHPEDIGDIASARKAHHDSRWLAMQPGQEDAVFSAQVRAQLVAALEQLSWRQREVLERVHLRGQTLKVVARALGVTESRCCQIAAEGCRALRDILEDPRDAA